MLGCELDHKFCKDCIKSYAETNLSNCKYDFGCLDDKCESKFAMNVLSSVLDTNLFSNLVRNIQNEEIRKAGIENLESCPHCDYAAIVDNPNERVFNCLNPDCLKETCR